MINILNEKKNNINGVKKLSYEELEQLSSEVRDLIIKTISMNGGDLASSLGVIEFTIALLYSFDFNQIKLYGK